MKDREELFYKPTVVCKDDMDKLDEEEMKKKRFIKKNVLEKKQKSN